MLAFSLRSLWSYKSSNTEESKTTQKTVPTELLESIKKINLTRLAQTDFFL